MRVQKQPKLKTRTEKLRNVDSEEGCDLVDSRKWRKIRRKKRQSSLGSKWPNIFPLKNRHRPRHTLRFPTQPNDAPSNCVWFSGLSRCLRCCRCSVCNWLYCGRRRLNSFRFDVCMRFFIFAFVLKCHSMALLFQFIYPHFGVYLLKIFVHFSRCHLFVCFISIYY